MTRITPLRDAALVLGGAGLCVYLLHQMLHLLIR